MATRDLNNWITLAGTARKLSHIVTSSITTITIDKFRVTAGATSTINRNSNDTGTGVSQLIQIAIREAISIRILIVHHILLIEIE